MKLNWFSPLPPARTDIGHFSARILQALAQCADVTLWTDQTEWDPELERYARVRCYDPAQLPWSELNRADISFYNIGNNAEFHLKIWQVSQQYPGIVILHDARVQEFFAFVHRWIHGDRNKYLEQMERYYGAKACDDGERWWRDELPITHMVENYPMTPWALQGAFGVYVHTRQAFDDVYKEPCRPIGCSPLPYPCTQGTAYPLDRMRLYEMLPYRLVLFGYIHKNRRLEPFLEALAKLPERQQFRLDIYGQLWDANYVRGKVDSLRLGDLVKIHGFVAEPELEAALSRSHLAINLRYPTMGEASGSQLRIWSHALPTLVTKVGMYADLREDSVAFVRPDHEIEDIQAQLQAFLDNPHRFAKMGEIGLQILAAEHSPEAYARSITEFAAICLSSRLNNTANALADLTGQVLGPWLSGSSVEAVLVPVAERIYDVLLSSGGTRTVADTGHVESIQKNGAVVPAIT